MKTRNQLRKSAKFNRWFFEKINEIYKAKKKMEINYYYQELLEYHRL